MKSVSLTCIALGGALALSDCVAKRPTTTTPPPPQIQIHEPKLRRVEPGDIVFRHPEQRADSFVCHHPAQVIDATKRRELVTVYQCR